MFVTTTDKVTTTHRHHPQEEEVRRAAEEKQRAEDEEAAKWMNMISVEQTVRLPLCFCCCCCCCCCFCRAERWPVDVFKCCCSNSRVLLYEHCLLAPSPPPNPLPVVDPLPSVVLCAVYYIRARWRKQQQRKTRGCYRASSTMSSAARQCLWRRQQQRLAFAPARWWTVCRVWRQWVA
jgi:hypothetical protein